MLNAFRNDLDLHSETELAIWGTDGPKRRLAKVINFGLAFGMTPKGFHKQTGVPLEQAEEYFQIYFTKFPGMDAFRHRMWNFVKNNGGSFNNMFGRTRRLPKILSSDKWEVLAGERETIASFAQGSAADLFKKALVRVYGLYKQKQWNVRLTLAVHDDMHTDCEIHDMPTIIPPLTHAMTHFPEVFRTVPVKTEHKWFTESWDEFHHHKLKKAAA